MCTPAEKMVSSLTRAPVESRYTNNCAPMPAIINVSDTFLTNYNSEDTRLIPAATYSTCLSPSASHREHSCNAVTSPTNPRCCRLHMTTGGNTRSLCVLMLKRALLDRSDSAFCAIDGRCNRCWQTTGTLEKRFAFVFPKLMISLVCS